MKEYHKIEGLYMREKDTKRLLPGVYRNPMVEYLKDSEWEFTEKIDGMNIRVVWDGHSVYFYGRTDNARIPNMLLNRLEELFCGVVNEEVFEQAFGDKEVILYGEGYGEKIQNGGNYIKGNDFILFDVEVDGKMLPRENVNAIAGLFGIDHVPVVLKGKLKDAEEYVKARPRSTIGTAMMEGLVGRPAFELMDTRGNRAIVKIKVRDYEEMEKYEHGT